MKAFQAALMLAVLMLSACSRQHRATPENSSPNSVDSDAAGVKRYALRGQIVRLDPVHSSVTIRHEKIEGWMDAMTMSFLVKGEAAFRSLHAGDRITATLYVRDQIFWISEVHREF